MGGRGQTERAHKRDGESLQRRRREKGECVGEREKNIRMWDGNERYADGRMDEWVACLFLKCLMLLISSGQRGRKMYSGQTISRRESSR